MEGGDSLARRAPLCACSRKLLPLPQSSNDVARVDVDRASLRRETPPLVFGRVNLASSRGLAAAAPRLSSSSRRWLSERERKRDDVSGIRDLFGRIVRRAWACRRIRATRVLNVLARVKCNVAKRRLMERQSG